MNKNNDEYYEVELSCNKCSKSYSLDELRELGENKLIYNCECGHMNLFIGFERDDETKVH